VIESRFPLAGRKVLPSFEVACVTNPEAVSASQHLSLFGKPRLS
jgi:hypothetical protein